MKLILFLVILVVSGTAVFTPVDSDLVSALKLKATSWVPYEVNENPLAGKTNMDLMHMFRSYGMNIDSKRSVVYDDYSDIPDTFNAADKFGDCILPIQSQELCGADWAMVAVQVLTERFCIVTNGTQKSMLSVNHVLSCDFKDWGCSGGFPDKAWDFLAEDGVVTEECNPFDAKDEHYS